MTVLQDEATVFVIDDDASMRDSLKWFLQTVGLPAETFASAEEFLESFSGDRPGCIVLDVRMPESSGLELQERLKDEPAAPPILMISGHGDVPMAVRAMQNGAFDFIEKPVGDQVLLERIQKAIALDRENRAARELQARFEKRMALLSTREREVFEIVVAGCPNKVVASRLGLSTKTIEVHRAHVMKKMKAKSLADLVKMAVALNVTKAEA